MTDASDRWNASTVLALAVAVLMLLLSVSVYQFADKHTLNTVRYFGQIGTTNVNFTGTGRAWGESGEVPEPSQIQFQTDEQNVSIVRQQSNWILEATGEQITASKLAAMLGDGGLENPADAMLTLGWANGELDSVESQGQATMYPIVLNYDAREKSSTIIRLAWSIVLIVFGVILLRLTLRSRR